MSREDETCDRCAKTFEESKLKPVVFMDTKRAWTKQVHAGMYWHVATQHFMLPALCPTCLKGFRKGGREFYGRT